MYWIPAAFFNHNFTSIVYFRTTQFQTAHHGLWGTASETHTRKDQRLIYAGSVTTGCSAEPTPTGNTFLIPSTFTCAAVTLLLFPHS